MSIDVDQLTESDVGRWVKYWPTDEDGRIKSWKGSLIFVVYHCDNQWNRFQEYTGAGTHHKSLNFKENQNDKEEEGTVGEGQER